MPRSPTTNVDCFRDALACRSQASAPILERQRLRRLWRGRTSARTAAPAVATSPFRMWGARFETAPRYASPNSLPERAGAECRRSLAALNRRSRLTTGLGSVSARGHSMAKFEPRSHSAGRTLLSENTPRSAPSRSSPCSSSRSEHLPNSSAPRIAQDSTRSNMHDSPSASCRRSPALRWAPVLCRSREACPTRRSSELRERR